MNCVFKNIILLFIGFSCLLAQDPIVNLPQGRIVGTKVYNDKSLIPIEIYYGIPFATPPVGRYRFSAPERHNGWKRTLHAHRPPPHCPHIGDITSDKTYYSEDCLFLNIWTSRPADGKLLPVLVILYSESWIQGGIALPCQDLAADDVVVVTVGYRLHFLGFFTLASVLARGNLALLDQYLAFLWIRDNIAAFGGDPNAITVLGHSAGADSVLYHLISPRSKGLFQRAVIMSPTDIWKFIDDQREKTSIKPDHLSREIASALGCSSNSDLEIMNCLRARPVSDILSLYPNKNWSKSMQPIPETYLPESEQFIPTSLLTALTNPKQSVVPVDLLLGTTDLEALNYNDETFDQLLKRNASYVSEFVNSNVIPELLKMFSLYREDLLPMLIRAIRWEHWDVNNKNVNMFENIEALARLETSARWGASGALLAARLARHVARLFVYRYSLPSTLDLEGRRLNHTGAVHGSDLIALLGDSVVLQVARRQATPEEKRFSSIFRRYMINFIKTGIFTNEDHTLFDVEPQEFSTCNSLYPESEDKWQRYRPGAAQIFEICEDDMTEPRNVNKDVKFWLQYLPELSRVVRTMAQSEQLTSSEQDEGRLRGGVFAMVGVAVVLLLLLCTSTILLHKQRLRRQFSIGEDAQN